VDVVGGSGGGRGGGGGGEGENRPWVSGIYKGFVGMRRKIG